MAGSAGGSGSSSTGRRSKSGSSASSTAGSTPGSDVANLESLGSSGADGSSAAPDGSAGSTAEGGSSGGNASADDLVLVAGHYPSFPVGWHRDLVLGGMASTDADAGQAKPDTSVELGSLFPEAGFSPVEYKEGLYAKEVLLPAKKADAKRLVDEAKKAADEAKKAADEMLKAAEEMSEAIEKAEDEDALIAAKAKLSATVDAKVYEVNVARSELDAVANPLDWTYYSGFPSGHHHRATDETLIKMYKLDRMANNEMWRVSFPDGWHAADYGLSDIIISEAEKFRNEKYKQDSEAKRQQILAKEGEIKDKDKQIADKDEEMKLKKEAVDSKNNQLEVKRREIAELREVINELNRQLRELENEARVLNSDHSKLFADYKLLELGQKKLEEDRAKLLLEHKILEDEDKRLLTDYYELCRRTRHFDGKFKEKEISFDPRDNFTSFTEELGLLEAGEGAVKPNDVYINPADTFSEHPLYTGASLSGGSAAPAAEAEVVETADATLTLDSGAQSAEGATMVADPAPAAEDHVASTPVSAPETHVAGEGATPLAEGTSAGEAKAEGTQSTPATLRLFKAGADGNDVEMAETTDYEKKHTAGDDRYEFKAGVKCTKVMYGVHELWKKGEYSVDEPKKVGFNGTANVVVVIDNERTVVYKREDNSDYWKHFRTVERKSGHGHSRSAAHTGSSASAPGSGEAEANSSVASVSSDNANESGSGSGLRGACANTK